jgi:hypothetical protein
MAHTYQTDPNRDRQSSGSYRLALQQLEDDTERL